jgi:hypothetical protein
VTPPRSLSAGGAIFSMVAVLFFTGFVQIAFYEELI